jgi:hypothetical protein
LEAVNHDAVLDDEREWCSQIALVIDAVGFTVLQWRDTTFSKADREDTGWRETPDLIITSDRAGANLPKNHAGSCKFLRAITLIPGSSNCVLGSHDIPMATIAHQGHYRIPMRNLDVKTRRSFLGGGQLLK